MADKHTPGPWEAVREHSTYWKIRSEEWGGIASLHDPLAAELGRETELEANARLIAATPALYAFVAAAARSGDNEAQSTLDSLGLG